MKLDADGARRGIAQRIAEPLKMDVIAAAQAIVAIANAKMSLAVREVSVEKGYDPRDFALVASGGAGPLHVLAIARELHIPKVIVPQFPSHFSALGMLMADERHDFIRTFYSDLASADFGKLTGIHDEMVAEATAALRHTKDAVRRVDLDIRYVGQEFTLPVPVDRADLLAADRPRIRAAFDSLYDQRYAHHSPDEPVEIVNIRVAVVGKRAKMSFPRLRDRGAATPARHREVYFPDLRKRCPVYARDELGAGGAIQGPALIQEHGTTTVLFATDRCTVAPSGELVITLGGA
jgi:N-methylhydantoinase A